LDGDEKKRRQIGRFEGDEISSRYFVSNDMRKDEKLLPRFARTNEGNNLKGINRAEGREREH